jgi:hypothetical protein
MPLYARTSSQIFGRSNRDALSNLNNITTDFRRRYRATPSRSAEGQLCDLRCQLINLRHRLLKRPQRTLSSLQDTRNGAMPNIAPLIPPPTPTDRFPANAVRASRQSQMAPRRSQAQYASVGDHIWRCGAKRASYRNSDDTDGLSPGHGFKLSGAGGPSAGCDSEQGLDDDTGRRLCISNLMYSLCTHDYSVENSFAMPCILIRSRPFPSGE